MSIDWKELGTEGISESKEDPPCHSSVTAMVPLGNAVLVPTCSAFAFSWSSFDVHLSAPLCSIHTQVSLVMTQLLINHGEVQAAQDLEHLWAPGTWEARCEGMKSSQFN